VNVHCGDYANGEHNNPSKSSNVVDVGTIESTFRTSYSSPLVTKLPLVLLSYFAAFQFQRY